MPDKILLVDDEQDLLDLLSYNLSHHGFDIVTATDGESAIRVAEAEKPDVIVLDIMMAGMSGFEVCAALRSHPELSQTAVLMLTAKTSEADEVRGLEVGADDYVPKPVSPKLLVSRVRALLRRISESRINAETDSLRVLDLLIDRVRYIVLRHPDTGKEERFHFPRKEFELLFLLAGSPGRVFTREELLDRIWGTDVYVTNRTVDVHIRKIRAKLGSKYIQTVKGVGYRFSESL